MEGPAKGGTPGNAESAPIAAGLTSPGVESQTLNAARCFPRFSAHVFTIDLTVESSQQFGFVSDERKFEIVAPEHNFIIVRLESNRASIVSFVDFLMS